MEEVTRKELWDKAGVAGLALGLVSTAYMFVSLLLVKPTTQAGLSVLMSLLSLVIWAAKFVGCILLMKFFLKKFCDTHPASTNSTIFKYGMIIALLSALIYSGIYLAYYSLIAPDALSETLDTAIASYSSMMDSNSLQMLDSLKENYVTISFFSNLIYCFIFGTVLSAILSRNIPSKNPFAGTDGTEEL